MSEQPSQWEMSHAMLIAVLMKLGGSMELELSDLEVGTMGPADGSLYAVEAVPIRDGTAVRLSVAPRPPEASNPGPFTS